MKKILLAAALVASLALVACDNNDDATPEPTAEPSVAATEAPVVTEAPVEEIVVPVEETEAPVEEIVAAESPAA